jgi:hypothetical protein
MGCPRKNSRVCCKYLCTASKQNVACDENYYGSLENYYGSLSSLSDTQCKSV